MNLEDFINASLDASDYGSASMAILAHPRSQLLSRPSITKLYDFGSNGVLPDARDVAMIEVLGDLMCVEIGGVK